MIAHIKENPTSDTYVSTVLASLPSFGRFALGVDFENRPFVAACLDDPETPNLWTNNRFKVQEVFVTTLLEEFRSVLTGSQYESLDGTPAPTACAEDTKSVASMLGNCSSGPFVVSRLIERPLTIALEARRGGPVAFDSDLRIFSFKDKVVEHNAETKKLTVRERRPEDHIMIHSPLSLGNFTGERDERLSEEEERCISEVKDIIARSIPDDEVCVYIMSAQACILMKYDSVIGMKQHIHIVGSRDCAKSFVLWLGQFVGGGELVVPLDPQQVVNSSELNRRALLNNRVRMHTLHEGGSLSHNLLKVVWVSQDIPATRKRGAGEFTQANAVASKLIRTSNPEDLCVRPRDDMLQKTIMVYELDKQGSRVLGKSVRTHDDLLDSSGNPRMGYFVADTAIRERFERDPKMGTAVARHFVRLASNATDFDMEKSAPSRIIETRDHWNSIRGDGAENLLRYEGKGFSSVGDTQEVRHTPTSQVQMISAKDFDSLEEARAALMQSVASTLSSDDEAAILRPLDVAKRIKTLAGPILWPAIGGPSDENLANGAAEKGDWAKNMHKWFADEVGRPWVDQERRYNCVRVRGRHMRGLRFAELVV